MKNKQAVPLINTIILLSRLVVMRRRPFLRRHAFTWRSQVKATGRLMLADAFMHAACVVRNNS